MKSEGILPKVRTLLAAATYEPQGGLPATAPNWRNPRILDPDVLAAKQADMHEVRGSLRIARLGERLNGFVQGGFVVADPWDPDLDDLIERGVAMLGPVAMFPGPMDRYCHWNSAFLTWAADGALRLATGYALSPNGLWVSHSWLVGPGGTDGVAAIVETTSRRLAYVGIVLDPTEAADRWDNVRASEFTEGELIAAGFSPSEVQDIVGGSA